MVITSVLSVFQYYIERHYSRGALRTLPLTPLQKVRKACEATDKAKYYEQRAAAAESNTAISSDNPDAASAV